MSVKEYEVTIKLVGNKSPCHAGHQIGEEWPFNFSLPKGLCSFAYNSLFPFAVALKTGGTFPWQSDPDVCKISCPDGEVSNQFEIRRKLKP